MNDITLDIKYKPMQDFISRTPFREMSDYLYEEYYLKKLPNKHLKTISSDVKKCREINQKYGTKVFLSSYLVESDYVLDLLDKELALWKEVSGGKAVMPKVIDFSMAKSDWYDSESAQGQSKSSAYANSRYTRLAFSAMSIETLNYALRHELMHLNDIKRSENIHITGVPEEKQKDTLHNIFINQEYKYEFINAGISEKHADYAYNDPQEFIAVAAEGDFSQYSDEFKQLLIDFGMPKWVQKLPYKK